MSKKSDTYKVIVVGGGASGLMAAVSALFETDSVLILEQKEVAAKKIPATGNGKCNFTHRHISVDDYFGSDPEASYRIYSQFDSDDVIAFFEGLGIPCFYFRDEYCYPYSRQASSIRDSLVAYVLGHGGKIKLSERVTDIIRTTDLFTVKTFGYEYHAENVIIAAGGNSSSCFGSDGSSFDLLKKLGHSIIKPLPGLVGLTSDYKGLNTLSGVRSECTAKLLINKNRVYSEYGEIIFNKTGISGIPIMNMSRIATRAINDGQECSVILDFYPEKSYNLDSLYSFLISRYNNSGLCVEDSFIGLHNSKLVYVLLKESGIDPKCTDRNASIDKALRRFASLLKGFEIKINGDAGFDNSQVTAGGVPLSEINNSTMESKNIPGLYIVGEALDTDGKCGGYNLQWAWTTGAIAGAYAGGGYFDKSKFTKDSCFRQ